MALAHFATADLTKPSFLTPTHVTEGRICPFLVCFTILTLFLRLFLGSMDSRGGKESNHVFRC
jgi:hypothetical protein